MEALSEDIGGDNMERIREAFQPDPELRRRRRPYHERPLMQYVLSLSS